MVMKIIFGLGNPGSKYEQTRHNVGFLAIDYFLTDKQTITCRSKFKAHICEYHQAGQKILFVKPETFMNLSGQAVSQLVQFYNIDYQADILVIHDEIDLPLGMIRSAFNSSAAGHNGVQNIIDELGSNQFHRIRIGVESRENKSIPPTESFVLQKFSDEELKKLKENLLPQVSQLIQKFIQ